MKVTSLLALVGLATATPTLVEREQILYCGKQPYYPSAYTCYPKNNNLLCPIINRVIYKACGPACYDPANYSCSNGKLIPVGTCSGVPFDKNSYVCVEGFLCPKVAPNLCGKACYDLKFYYCKNGKLMQQPK